MNFIETFSRFGTRSSEKVSFNFGQLDVYADEQDENVCNEIICYGWWPDFNGSIYLRVESPGNKSSPKKMCCKDWMPMMIMRMIQRKRGDQMITTIIMPMMIMIQSSRGETRPSIVAIFTCGQWQWHHPDLAILTMYTILHSVQHTQHMYHTFIQQDSHFRLHTASTPVLSSTQSVSKHLHTKCIELE